MVGAAGLGLSRLDGGKNFWDLRREGRGEEMSHSDGVDEINSKFLTLTKAKVSVGKKK